MPLRFRPKLETLQAREVPAALSFQLSNGAIGSGTFTTPDGVDPMQPSQTFTVTDVSIAEGSGVYTAPNGISATYNYGVLVGMNGVLSNSNGSDSILLNGTMMAQDAYAVPVAYDGAATRDTFTLPDGSVGSLSYTIPWNQVDSSQASQSLTPTAFNLNLAGQNFAYGSANYTQQPTLVFSYGNFVGVSFALNPPSGFAYTSVTGSFDINGNNIIAAIQAATGQQFVAAPVPQQNVVLDFASAYTGQDYWIRMTFYDGKGNGLGNVIVKVSKTDSAADIANKVAASINATGNFTASANGTTLTVKPTATGRGWERLSYENLQNGGVPFQNPVPGPTLEKRNVVNVIGDVQSPSN